MMHSPAKNSPPLLPPAQATLWTVFSILSICRWQMRSVAHLSRALKQRGVQPQPRLKFWVHICRAAGLLDDTLPLQPTLFATDFLKLPLLEQLDVLLNAWIHAAVYLPLSDRRAAMVERLKHWGSSGFPPGEAPRFNPAFQRELPGLAALALWEGDGLSELGRAYFSGQVLLQQKIVLPQRPNPAPWLIERSRLRVPFPPNWRMLWTLEQYLEPRPMERSAELVFSISDYLLRRAAGRGPIADLANLLERGTGRALPEKLRARLTEQPAIRLLNGTVIEFDDPEELARLHRARPLRNTYNEMLSPRHLLLSADQLAPALRWLKGKGLFEPVPIPEQEQDRPGDPPRPRPGFTAAERTYLLSLVKMAAALNLPGSPPLGLEQKLEKDLPAPLRAAAARRVKTARRQFTLQDHTYQRDESLPRPPHPELLAILRECITRQEAVDILYEVPTRQPQERHISPLLLEQRGLNWYLVAYCHLRRTNRTFRLDRMALKTWGQENPPQHPPPRRPGAPAPDPSPSSRLRPRKRQTRPGFAARQENTRPQRKHNRK